MGFSRQEYWSGLPFPPPGDLPDLGIKPMSLMSPALAGGFTLNFPGGSDGEGSACNAGDLSLILGWEDPLKAMATHSSILSWRTPMDRGAWRVTAQGVTESDTTERLSLTHSLPQTPPEKPISSYPSHLISISKSL